ncbi:hypothetical protein D3C78_1759610 [compost metagenome]
MDAVFEELRRHVLITLGQWLERIGINRVVEGEDWTVDAFPRIFFRGGLSGERYQQGAGGKTQLS